MLLHLTILFPCMVASVWFLVFLVKARKMMEYSYLTFLSGCAAVFLFFNACSMISSVSYRTLIIADIAKQFFGPCLALFCWYYLRLLKGDKKPHTIIGYLITIPTIMMSVCGISYIIMGLTDAQNYLQAFDQLGHFPEEFDEPIFRINYFCHSFYDVLEAVVVLYLIGYIIRDLIKTKFSFKNFFEYLFKGKSENLHHIQCLNLLIFILLFGFGVFMERNYFLNHPQVAIILSIAYTIDCLLIAVPALCGNHDNLTIKGIFSLSNEIAVPVAEVSASEPEEPEAKEESPEANEETENNVEDIEDDSQDEETEEEVSAEDIDQEEDENEEEDDENDEETDDESESSSKSVIKYDESLVDKFKAVVIDQKLYLKNGLTVKSLCSELGTNKTYLSKMVNERFGMPFPNYINLLRVEYAKQYLLDHPDAKQEEVADESGFPNAAGFNRSFKKITGTTPRIWLAKNMK